MSTRPRLLCRRCHVHYTADGNHPRACRFHSAFFVQRWHPNERAAHGDVGAAYYSEDTSVDGWAAKFWDCCGSEDERAPGCCYAKHASYDDNDDGGGGGGGGGNDNATDA